MEEAMLFYVPDPDPEDAVDHRHPVVEICLQFLAFRVTPNHLQLLPREAPLSMAPE